jgi:hypothetical protein
MYGQYQEGSMNTVTPPATMLGVGSTTERQKLRIFISYASEDRDIAIAIGDAFVASLDDDFAEINLDKWFLQAGYDFQRQIERKLDQTDVLIVVFTGVEKESHGYTGWEVGYFTHAMKDRPTSRQVPIFLNRPPPTLSVQQGISIGIDASTLSSSIEDFDAANLVLEAAPMCMFLRELQEAVDSIRINAGFGPVKNKPDAQACVANMRARIFRYLRTTIESTLRPQKQLLFKTTGAEFLASSPALPPNAEIHPVGLGNGMSIFGLPDAAITWNDFLKSTAADKYCDSWRQAITSVIGSSFPDKVNVDNSQIIISEDETKSYRLILTTCTKYYDDRREFSLYFVEALKRSDFGREDTSILLKGLEIVCRFRFIFLEVDSNFSGNSVRATALPRLADKVTRLVKEIDLLGRDARDAGLDQPNVWRQFVDWDHVLSMFGEYEPRELRLREVASEIMKNQMQHHVLEPLRGKLADVIADLESVTRPNDTLLIRAMSAKLQSLVAGEQ